MRAWPALLMLLTAVPAFADDKEDWKALIGTWTLEKVTIDGSDQTAVFKDAVLVIEDGKYKFTFSGQDDKGKLTIDSSKAPKTMDVVGEEGPNKGKTIPCIYKLEDKSVVICYSFDDKKRPEKFDSGKDSKTMIITYKKKI
jgi:uncharacterized protein (TIGR03067 family)